MEITGFNESKTGQKGAAVENTEGGRADMRTEVKHFTTEMTTDSAYGWTWNQVVKEYLKTGYKVEGAQMDVVVLGVTYRILKRPEVTVFYDASGNTLFDVTNERIEKEYEWLMNSGDREDDNVIPMGKASLKEIATGLPAPTVEEIEAAREENAKPVKQRAKEKLEKELEVAKDSMFADPIIGYLLKRCEEDEGLAQDVIQEHKTWNKCVDYIFSQARKQSRGNCAAVRDDVVYEWAEDYYHRDDKAEEEKKKAENKAKREKAARWLKEKNTDAGKTNKTADPKKDEVQKELPKPTRNGKDMEGQLDLFSMMGM